MNLLFRVLVGAFVCVAPSLLFLGLWHGLKRMQDGEFVGRVAGHHGASVEDLLPTTRSSHELDPAERHRQGHMAIEGDSPNHFDEPFPSEDEPPG